MGIYVKLLDNVVIDFIDSDMLPDAEWIEVIPGESNKIAFIGDHYDIENNMFFTPIPSE
jgi:hypothetical protein